jgi:hypothetical protein
VRYTIEPLLGLIRGERAGGRAGVSDAERARASSEELGMGRHWIDGLRGPSLDAVTDASRAPYPACRFGCPDSSPGDIPAELTHSNVHNAAGRGHRGAAQACTGAIGG